jgi:hypothetical protein
MTMYVLLPGEKDSENRREMIQLRGPDTYLIAKIIMPQDYRVLDSRPFNKPNELASQPILGQTSLGAKPYSHIVACLLPGVRNSPFEAAIRPQVAWRSARAR